MKLSETFTYPGIDVDAVYGIIVDEEFRVATCEDQGALSHDVSIDGSTVTITREMPADLPDFVKKFTGSTVKAKQTEQWRENGDGYIADVKFSVVGQPAEMLGTAELKPTGSGTEFIVKGDVKVSIPLIGRKIEPEIHKQIVKGLNAEVALGVATLNG